MAELGIDLIGAAKAAAGAFLPGVFGPGGNGAPGVAPAPDALMAPGSTPGATISPAIQAQISPQISPTMVQQQASPGAGVQAAPTMSPGTQTAVPMGVPGLPPPPMGPMQPLPYGYGAQPYGMAPSMPFGTPTAFQTGGQRVNWTLIAVAGAVAVGVIVLTGRRRRRP